MEEHAIVAGAQIGQLQVLAVAGVATRYRRPVARWQCRYACGTLVLLAEPTLRRGTRTSCGHATAARRPEAAPLRRTCGRCGIARPPARFVAPAGADGVLVCDRCAALAVDPVPAVPPRRGREHAALTERPVDQPDLAGQRFGALVVEAVVGARARSDAVLWRCRCDCGLTSIVADEVPACMVD